MADPRSLPLPHCPPSPLEVFPGPRFLSCSPQHKNALWVQPWSRELSLGQSLDCHYLQGKKNLWYHGKLLLKAFWLVWAAGTAKSSMGRAQLSHKAKGQGRGLRSWLLQGLPSHHSPGWNPAGLCKVQGVVTGVVSKPSCSGNCGLGLQASCGGKGLGGGNGAWWGC